MSFSNESHNYIYLKELNNAMIKLLIPNTVLLFAFLITSLAGNGLVLYVYTLKLKSKTDDRYFIPCLAFVDIITCSTGASFLISLNFNPLNFRNDLICKLIWSLNHSIALISGMLLLAIALQRYIKVSRLLNSSMTLRSKRLTITAIIIGSIIISVPCLFFYGEAEVPLKNKNRTITGYNCGAVPNVNRNLLLAYSVTLLLISLSGIFALITLYSVILSIIYKKESVRKRNNYRQNVNVQHGLGNTNNTDGSTYTDAESYSTNMDSTTTSNQQQTNEGKPTIKENKPTVPAGIRIRWKSKTFRILCRIMHKHRFFIMFFLIAILSCISYLPRFALMITGSVISNFWYELTDVEYFIALCFYRGYLLNTAVNPVIYLVFDTDFRSSCKQLCCSDR
ncbi:5-hydroxytryptamine receptor 1D-like [Mytilus trossulus]|uniref:5-hydroxytryptamine receptor 1D-like n=1 Tax=Mytilus trossulus TaxID=6551 RepID=UPI0030077D06